MTSRLRHTFSHHSQRVSILTLVFVLVLVSLPLSLLVNTRQASARTFTTEGIARSHEVIVDFIEVCSGAGREKVNFTNNGNSENVRIGRVITESDANKGNYFHIVTGGGGNVNTGEYKVKMSHLFNNEKLQCKDENLSKRAVETLYGSNSAFLSKFYNKVGQNYELKSTYRENGAADGNADHSKITPELRRQAVAEGFYVVKNGGQYPTDPYDLRDVYFRKPFEDCFKPKATQTDAKYIVTSPEGKKFEIKDGKKDKVWRLSVFHRSANGLSNFSGGMNRYMEDDDGDSETTPDDDKRNQMTCFEFAVILRAKPAYFQTMWKTIDELNEEAAAKTREEKIAAIAGVFAGSRDRLNACLVAVNSDLTPPADPTAAEHVNTVLQVGGASALDTQVAKWLVDNTEGETEPLTSGSYPDPPWTLVSAEKGDAFRTCLLSEEGYGTEITDTLAIEPPVREPTDASGEAEEDNSCESNGGVLGWILCPVAEALDSTTRWIDDQVTNLLTLNVVSDSSDQIKQAWIRVRDIAYVILIPMMLVMVIATALGSQMFDAYTVKKALPRMAIAIVFIALSWYACLLLVNFVNALGNGVQGIITHPFNPQGDLTLAQLLADAGITGAGNGASGGNQAGVLALGLLGGGVALAAGVASLGIIISTLFSVIIVMLIAFFLLVARQIILVGLILASPLAILSWVFPGNDKLWKFWWGAFSKLLFLFPVIQAMIAMGKVFAAIVGGL